MNISEYNKRNYENLWKDLNKYLKELANTNGGLPSALSALESHQIDLGFIQDDLKSIVRYRFCDPLDRSRAFTIQYNPRRALRQHGAGRTAPPPGSESIHNGCFLCKENVRWQHRGLQIGFDIEVKDTPYIAWITPFPLMPTHCVIAAKDHIPQAWASEKDERPAHTISDILLNMLDLAGRLPGFIGFYNGDGAGATIPGHFHFQFFKRPEGYGLFALEQSASSAVGDTQVRSPLLVRQYPVKAVYFWGSQDEIVEQIQEWMKRGRNLPRSWPALTANIIVTRDTFSSKQFHLYFVPRNKLFSHAPGLSGVIASLEIMGELVFCTEKEKQSLDILEVDYHYVARILSAIEAPRMDEFLKATNFARSNLL